MSPRSLRFSAALSFAFVLVIGGCQSLRPLSTRSPAGERVITEAQIRATGATSAWEALRRTLPHLGMREDRNGRPSKIYRRGQSSILLDDQPSIYVDGARIADVQRLRQMPASDISRLRFLSGIDGTTRYGTNSGDGVILIQTKGSAL